MHPKDWIEVGPGGIHVRPGDFWIDPTRAVERAVITHGHGDHARAGHGAVLATRETLAIMHTRFGDGFAGRTQTLTYGEALKLDDVEICAAPAGHILGSAQMRVAHAGGSIVFSGDYKRRLDPTCPPFDPMKCDVFVTEATFGLPVFVHPPIDQEIGRLLTSLRQFPESCHLVGCYVLGKCQRLIAALRAAGFDEPIHLHGAHVRMCQLYEQLGVSLGPLVPVGDGDRKALAGKIVLCPPGALHDRWAAKLPEPITASASGWMRIRARAKQAAVELPLVISDHCDWPELVQTLEDVGAPEVWVTHGREEALIHHAQHLGYRAAALRLLGYDEEEE